MRTDHRRTCAVCIRGLLAGLVLSLGPVPGAWAGEWEDMRDRLDEKIRSHARRLADIDAREQGDPADPIERAAKITRDRIARVTAMPNRGAKPSGLGAAAELGTADRSALADLSREQGAQLEGVIRDWGSAGPERRKVRESLAAVQKNFERANGHVAQAIDAAAATGTGVAESRVGEAIGRLEAEAAEVGDRLRARWQREFDARERERLFRERAAAERERGVR